MSVTEAEIPEIFYLDGWITEVNYLVSSGKEGTLFCCQAGPHTGHDLLAVKNPPRSQAPIIQKMTPST